jgi:Ca2+-binding RTX toxin-like protein
LRTQSFGRPTNQWWWEGRATSNRHEPLLEIACDIEEAAMYITGKFIKFQNLYFDDFDDPLPGTNNNDTIVGLGGDDQIWGDLGNDEMYGGTGDDVIKPGKPNDSNTGHWGYDTAYGDEGNDELDFSNNMDNVELHGGSGNDYVVGGSGNDKLYGGTGIDHLYGNNGNDTIYVGGKPMAGNDGADYDPNYAFAGGGNDYVYGSWGDDWIFGAAGDDWLYGKQGNDVIFGQGDDDVIFGGGGQDVLCGGSGWDSFVFDTYDSYGYSDTITDFDCTHDFIDLSQSGTSSNYTELTVGYSAGYNEAKWAALDQLNGTIRNVFVTDGVNGYLFVDYNGNGLIENGIVLEDLNSLSDFSYGNISNIL